MLDKKDLLANPLSRLYIGDEISEKTECTDIVYKFVVTLEKMLIISLEKIKKIKNKLKEDPSLVKII